MRLIGRSGKIVILSVLLFSLLLAGFCAQGTHVTGGSPPADPEYVFIGRGRAHGVGLCMDGVLYRALEGRSYRQILNYYYTDVQFDKTDDKRSVRVLCRDGKVRVYPLREYLYRLAEEPDTFQYEGLKALFVAARTYTLSCIARGKHESQGFDVCSSGSCCQAFDENKDISKFPNSVRAVNETAGEILVYKGRPIIAAYHGSCGGHTENNEDVWGGSAIPYLRGKPDDYCSRSPRFSWSLRLRRSEIESRLNASPDTRVGSFKAIDIKSRTPGGRVDDALVRGTDATVSVKGRILASRLGLPGALFDIPHSQFDEYLLLLNPSDKPNRVAFTFMERGGGAFKHSVEIAGNSRYTLNVNKYLQFAEHSTKISAEKPVVCERTMYFGYGSCTGGSACSGVPLPQTRWYFAEGYTQGSFDTYVLIQNPASSPANLKIRFFTPAGESAGCSICVPPFSRTTLRIDDFPDLSSTEVSTVVESKNGVPVVAERAVYFSNDKASDGNSEAGCPKPSKKWYLAEGYTGGDFNTYILIFNPGNTSAKVRATFMKEDGRNIINYHVVKPRTRYTIDAGKVPGISGSGFGTLIESTDGVPVVVERSMYFKYNGFFGGHDGRGAEKPSLKWYFAEGFTGGEFDTYFLIQNPSREKALIRILFAGPSGKSWTRSFEILPMSRLTLGADQFPEISKSEFSVTIKSTNHVGVVAERAMYFRYLSVAGVREGGHLSAGVRDTKKQWYFAEGYTGY